MPVSRDFVRYPGNIETAQPEGFLFQGGYLTLRPCSADYYSLDYPNREVLQSMSNLVSMNILGGESEILNFRNRFFNSLINSRDELLISVFNQLFSCIPYDDYTKAAQEAVLLQGLDIQPKEWLYRSCLIAFLCGLGTLVFGETHNNKGRTDIVFSYRGHTDVVELKVAYENESGDKKLEEAIGQIKSRNYAGQYPDARLFALVIDDKERQIAKWQNLQ
jgi:hypothetical protein